MSSKRQVKDLQQRVGANASNSSIPPSANPPQAPPPVVKKHTGRKTGGQPGHNGHQRLRLPPERVQHTIALVPTHCEDCHAPLPQRPSPGDPEPVWHQFAELSTARRPWSPSSRATPGPAPAAATSPARPSPPRSAPTPSARVWRPCWATCRAATTSVTAGLEEISEVVFGVPLSLGSVTALQGQLGEALASPHQEIAEAVQPAPVKNVDETGWKQAGKKRWLWTAVTGTAALLPSSTSGRGAEGLKALLGETIGGLVCSDRWSAYHLIPVRGGRCAGHTCGGTSRP